MKLNYCSKIYWIIVKSCHYTFHPQFGSNKNEIKRTSADIFNLKWGLSKAWYLKIKGTFFIPHWLFQVFPSNVKFLDLPGISFINIYFPFHLSYACFIIFLLKILFSLKFSYWRWCFNFNKKNFSFTLSSLLSTYSSSGRNFSARCIWSFRFNDLKSVRVT